MSLLEGDDQGNGVRLCRPGEHYESRLPRGLAIHPRLKARSPIAPPALVGRSRRNVAVALTVAAAPCILALIAILVAGIASGGSGSGGAVLIFFLPLVLVVTSIAVVCAARAWLGHPLPKL